MSSINNVTLTGHLTRNAEFRTTKAGTGLVEVSVAVNERVRGEGGGWEDRTSYIDCTLFGRRAEPLSEILAKGMKIAVSGHIRQDRWEAPDGSKRSKVYVLADEIDLCSSVN